MKRWVIKWVPSRDAVLQSRCIRPFAHRLANPCIWHFNRHSVARGLALGLFTGFLIPLGQSPAAALLALSMRANILVAVAATLITNPLTFAAIYFAAYQLGNRLLDSAGFADLALGAASEGRISKVGEWLLSMTVPTALGLLIFATAAAFIGYWTVQLSWRWWIARRWIARRT